MATIRKPARGLLALGVAFGLAACGGGGGGSSGSQAATPSSITPTPSPSPAPSPTPAPTPAPTPSPSSGTPVLSYSGTAVQLAAAQKVVTTRQLQATVLVDDPAHGKVIAGVLTSSGSSKLVAMDPASLQTAWTYNAPSYISRFTLADDGKTLYALMPDVAAVWQFDLATRQPIRIISMTGGIAPLDVAVRPGHPGTIVVASGAPGAVSPAARVQAYDDGIPRPVSLDFGTNVFVPSNEIEFIDADTLISLDNQTTACQTERLSLTANGLTAGTSVSTSECFDDILYKPMTGLFVTRTGRSFDPSTLQINKTFDGGATGLDRAIFHPGLMSFIRLSGDNSSGRMVHYINVEEYSEAGRQYLRRRFVAVSSPQPFSTGVGVTNFVLDAVSAGTSRVVLVVYDLSDSSAHSLSLMSFDLADVSELPPWDLSARTVSNDSFTSWSISAPTLSVSYDADQDRIIAALPPVLGPNGNSLAVIRPDTGAVDRIIQLDGEASQLAVSAHGSIAYVSIGASRMVQKIDLKTGAVLGTLHDIYARGLAVKEDDPDTVAIFSITQQLNRHLKSYTGFVEAPDDLTDSNFDLQNADVLGTNGANDLIVYEETSLPKVWHINWTNTGLTIGNSFLSMAGVGGPTPKLAFGRVSTIMGVVDVNSGQRYTSLSAIGADDFALIDTSTGVDVNFSAGYPTPNLRWRQAPTQPDANDAWPVIGEVTLVDQTIPSSSEVSYSILNRLQAAGTGRLVLSSNLFSQYFSHIFQPSAGYLYAVQAK